jgi:hypothetical protein
MTKNSLDSDEACTRDKVAVATSACENACQQYDDYYKSFSGLDGKAQATATVSGVALAAIAAFLQGGQVASLLHAGCWHSLAVLAPPSLALMSVILSLIGSKVTDVVVPFDSAERIQEAKDLAELDCSEFSQQHVLDYYRAQLEHWILALQSIDSAVETKARWILWGQISMICSLIGLVVLYILILHRS